MSFQVGYIDEDGHARLKLKVFGTNPGAIASIDALLDTGFTGFLMLPVALAIPLGLVLYGTGDYTLADGSVVTNFLGKGSVSIGPAYDSPNNPVEIVEGVIVLAGDEPLVGMEFLRALHKMVVLASNAVFLITELPDG